MRWLSPLLLSLLLVAPRPAGSEDPVRVVLFIGDGVGVSYWSAAYLAAGELSIQAFPVTGLFDPGNTSSNEPESGSAATALAIGERTFDHSVGVGVDSLPRETVLEAAIARGLATGMVTTTALTDATPAAFASHVSNRREYAEIARQIASQGIDVMLGDGRPHFAEARLPDGRSVLESMVSDYTFVESAEELRQLDTANVERLLGFFDIDAVEDPDLRQPSLAEMTTTALEVLSHDTDGFFLLVETEHPDHRGHDNAPLDIIEREVLELDRAVEQALRYQAAHPETLIIVAGDHETGGLGVLPQDDGALAAVYHTRGHTASLVPIFAIGPGAGRFGGLQTNDAIGRLLLDIVRSD